MNLGKQKIKENQRQPGPVESLNDQENLSNGLRGQRTGQTLILCGPENKNFGVLVSGTWNNKAAQ